MSWWPRVNIRVLCIIYYFNVYCYKIKCFILNHSFVSKFHGNPCLDISDWIKVVTVRLTLPSLENNNTKHDVRKFNFFLVC